MQLDQDMSDLQRDITIDTLIVGGGPAGTGPLVHAATNGSLESFLQKGVAVVEAGSELCVGRLGNYVIESNSAASSFIECLEHPRSAEVFATSVGSAEYQRLREVRWETVDLSLVAGILRRIGVDIKRALVDAPNAHLCLDSTVTSIVVSGDNDYIAKVRTPAGDVQFRSRNVVLATGGDPRGDEVLGQSILLKVKPGSDVPEFLDSEALLTGHDLPRLRRLLSKPEAHVVILGSSHSAFSAANLLAPLANSISIVHRGRIKVFYPSMADAHAEGYRDFGQNDVCPETGRVFRIAGLRGHARSLYRRIVAPGYSGNVQLVSTGPKGQLPDLNWGATQLVVFALGYDFRSVPLEDVAGQGVRLQGKFTGRFVDGQCRIIGAHGRPIEGLYAIGMATGFIPTGKLGGEPSFTGRDNSVWLCQHLLGQMLYEQLSS